MRKILHLTLKKKWFDMIASGEKKEEYREIKPYWMERLEEKYYDEDSECINYGFRDFDYVVFTNGYGKKNPTIKMECLGISVGAGKPKWGGGDKTYIIKIGNEIERNF